MAFKIKDSLVVATTAAPSGTTVINGSGEVVGPLFGAKVRATSGATYGGTLTTVALAANRTYTYPDKDGTVAMISDIGGAAYDGTLTAAALSAGSTNTTVDLSFSGTFSANTASNITLKTVVGPALTALASAMTGAGSGFLKKSGADTFSLDTNTYLTSSTGVSTISFGTTGLTPATATSGAITVSGTLALANGGTGATSAQTAINALAGAVTSGQYLRGNGTNVVMSAIQAGDVPTLNQNTTGNAATATSLAGGSAGAVVYQSATGTSAFLTAGTSSQVLVGGAAAPSWTNTPTLTGTNFTGIPNGALSNSTISGVALGGTLATLTAGAALTWSSGTNYNGSAAATLAIDAAAAGTPTAWASVTTGSVSIAAGLTTGTLNLAASGTGANTINVGNANSTVVLNGNVTINGTTTTVNVATITVDDINIELGSVASPTNVTANGGGITLKGTTDKTILWDNPNGNWTSSEDWNLPTGKVFKINNVSILSATALGSSVVSSSLTSVGTITTGTWSGSFGAVSGANLTSLTAGNLSGTIPSAVLGNSTHYIGTTAIALNRASANQALTGILSTTFAGATSGTIQLIPTAVAGSNTITLPAATGTVALTSDIPTVNNGTLTTTASTAGATNTGIEVTLSAGWSANSASNVTIKNTVGPAISALVSTMTGAGTGFLRKNGADTYTLDTNTYLTSYTETDTLQTVTGRGATTTAALSITNTTDSTSNATGALIVSGGVAVQKNLTVSGSAVNTTSGGTKVMENVAVQATVATTTPSQVLDSWSVTTYRSAKYTVQVAQGTGWRVSEIMVLAQGTTADWTEYAVIDMGSLSGTVGYTVDVSGGNARLLVTNSSATSATFNINKTLMFA